MGLPWVYSRPMGLSRDFQRLAVLVHGTRAGFPWVLALVHVFLMGILWVYLGDARVMGHSFISSADPWNSRRSPV